MAYLLDVVPVLPADHLMFPGAAVALAELRVQRYRLVGDPDSLAAAAETATVACRTIRPDDPARGASLPMMLGVLVESAVVLGTPSPEEVLLIALESGLTQETDVAQRFRDPDQSRRMASALESAVTKRYFQLPGASGGSRTTKQDCCLTRSSFSAPCSPSAGVPNCPAEVHAAIAFADCTSTARGPRIPRSGS